MQRWKVFLAHAAATQESRPPETRTIALGASGPGTERLVIEELQCGSYPQIGKTKRDWGNGPTVPHRHSGSDAEFLCALEQSGALRVPPLHVRGAPRLDLGTRVVLLPLLEELLLVLLPVLSLLGLPGFPLLGREVRELLPLPGLLPLALLVDLRQALANRVLVKLGDLVADLFHQAHDTLRCYAACAAKRELQNRRTLKYKNNYSSANFENQLGGLGPDLLCQVEPAHRRRSGFSSGRQASEDSLVVTTASHSLRMSAYSSRIENRSLNLKPRRSVDTGNVTLCSLSGSPGRMDSTGQTSVTLLPS